MYLITVYPLAKGVPYEELTYFSKLDLAPGDLVEVSVRKRNLRALVVFVSPLENEKQSLKNASFVTKKITKLLIKEFLPVSLWKELEYSSSYHLRSVGKLIYGLLSEKSFEALCPLASSSLVTKPEVLLLEQSYENRIQCYKTTIREMFSKKKSLVIFFPTITDLENAKSHFIKGIEDYILVLHSGLTDKTYIETQKRLQEELHPVLILSTPSLVPWARKDLGMVVIEREHSQYYYTHGDDGVDMRRILERLAYAAHVPCLLGSHMLSLRAHLLYATKDAHEVMPFQYRNDTGVSVVAMIDSNKTESPYISKPALKLLREVFIKKDGHYFFYAHRKGMYPTTICSDCGELYTCKTCNRPYVLHKVGGLRTYVCHGCESIVQLDKDTTLACDHCHGWRMATLGISTTGIEEELASLGIPLFVIDGERTPTKAKVKKVYNDWLASPYGILIGTEMAHNVITTCDGIIVLSMDALFSLPEYRTDEKIISLVTEMSEKIHAKEGLDPVFIFQTRLQNLPVMKQLSSPSFRDVYVSLLEEREAFLLPPYFTIIKASYENLTEEFRKKISEELSPYSIFWFEQGKGVTLLLIHIKEKLWSTDEDVRRSVKRIVYDARPVVNPLHLFID